MTATSEPTAPPNVYVPPKTLAAFLIEARTRAQVTQAAVAKVARMPLDDWRRLERGEGIAPLWSEATVRAIARALTADKDELARLYADPLQDARLRQVIAEVPAQQAVADAAAADRAKRLRDAALDGLVPGKVEIKIRLEGHGHWLFTETVLEALDTILCNVPKPHAHVAWRLSFGEFSVFCAHTQALDEAIATVATGTRMRALAVDRRFAGTALDTFELERVVLTEEQCLTMGEFEGW